ncbi:MAG: helix-turn-helix domain-containing protein [Proteobacteria bacterium]|nr:helix-turn-helix domain-containing protein [Pseudomonadota bacterium]
MENQIVLRLPPSLLESRTDVLNARCTLRTEGGRRVVVVSGVAVHGYSADDEITKRYVMVSLVEAGHATQEEVARAFGGTERTLRRMQRRFEEGGMAGLMTQCGWRPGRRRLPEKRLQEIERLHAEGVSNREIARRLGVTENAIRKQVGPTKDARQLSLPGAEHAPVIAAMASPSIVETPAPATRNEALAMPSLDDDPRDRSLDRGMACLGLLDDAAPLFADAEGVSGAGVLCVLPALVHGGVFRVAAKLYGGIGPAFYGLRTTMLVLVFMALWRIKRPESLKERDPASLGLVLGLDRAPEVKTVRRKLTRLAARHKAAELAKELARTRVAKLGAAVGFLYVDGHVRAYHGERDIPKAHVARMRLSMPATTDYWVGDTRGDPLFVLTAEANAGMVEMLPRILREIRGLVGDRRVTVVFDRGGWSPRLFKLLVDEGFDFLTYRKGKSELVDESLFASHRAVFDGRPVEYLLHYQEVGFLDDALRLRQVTRLSDDGHQTQIVTSRVDLDAAEVAFRMFGRWRQENFFKYGREEFALDALADYQIEPDDPTRTVPNPARRDLAKQIKIARNEIKALEQALGAALIDAHRSPRPGIPALADAHADAEPKLAAARENLARLRAALKQTPERVEIRDLSDGAVVKLAAEKKSLTNIIKMIAFQTESDLLALLAPAYRRAEDEGRTLLHELFSGRADLKPSATELRVVLHPLSSPHRTAALAGLCRALNETETRFPGSNLVLLFDVLPLPPSSFAFPGPRPAPEPPANDPPDI